MSDSIAVRVDRVSKSYSSEFRAVSGLSFAVKPSQCFGLLGPNGAGKSSLMRMLYNKTLRDRDEGTIEVFGLDPLRDELGIKYVTGIVPQDDNLDVELDIEDNLSIYGTFYGIPSAALKAKIGELLEFMELTEKRKSRVRELSGGMRRRLIIARALLNDPKLLLLDEPTTGLDPQVRHLIWDKLRLLKKQGVTMILTTHYMDEAFQICDELLIMDKGHKVLQGVPARLIKDHIEGYVLEIITRDGAGFQYEGTARREQTHDRLLFYSDSAAELESIARQFEAGEYYLRQSNLEDVFLKTTGRSLHE